MKHFKSILSAAFLLTLVFSCKNEPKTEIITVETTVEKPTQKLDPNATYSKAEFNIKGMTCEMGCAKTIEKKLTRMEGVKSATVDFKNELAMVEYDVAKANPSSITKTVISVADTYSVENMQTVAAFSGSKKACEKACEKACCTDKLKDEKKACASDCKKECCAKKA
jgi:periplasmic mercuric ion binding protein